MNHTRSPGANATNSASVEEVLEVFDYWLILHDHTPIYAVLGAVSANLLPGDPVWLGLKAPPSSAKTEILNSTSMLPHVVQASTLTPAALLSGTPRKQHEKGAHGGLLRQIGDFGIVAAKDFGTILSMPAEKRAEILAALREIYDGRWTRHFGTDGGKTLDWKGKLGFIFGTTAAIDSHYSVIAALGDRFLLNELTPTAEGQFKRALKHVGAANAEMRTALATAVQRLFAHRRATPQPITEEEFHRLDRVLRLVVRLRGAIDRDRYSREIEAVHGAEGPARIGLMLERLLAGLDVLGVARATALNVVERVAMDSVPQIRRKAYEKACNYNSNFQTAKLATAIGLPTSTTRRALEDLAAYGILERESGGQGNPDSWELKEEWRNAHKREREPGEDDAGEDHAEGWL
jgi:hypothetical protein